MPLRPATPATHLEAKLSRDPFGFVAKLFNERALLVTIEIAMRQHETEEQLAEAAAAAEAALARGNPLEGILPFCSY